MKTDRQKLTRVLKRLEQVDVIHGYYDVLDYGVEDVLSWYGIVEKWTDEERKDVHNSLFRMVYQKDIDEEIRLVDGEDNPIFVIVPDGKNPSPILLEMRHEAWMEKMKKKSEMMSKEKDADLFEIVKK